MTPRISVTSLCKSYMSGGLIWSGFSGLSEILGGQNALSNADQNFALNRVSFDIADGERVGIIGENGAGKSTLLQLLAGVSNPTSGKINIVGHVHAVLTLGLGLREDYTGRENLYLDAEVQGISRKKLDETIEEIIEFIDIGEFIDRPVRTYSSGMKSRLAFASLVFVEPEILLIDEALSAGDHKFSVKADEVIQQLCKKGRIIIVVSHSLESIVRLCDRCLWLDKGKLIADGDPEDVTSAYRKWIRERDEKQLLEKFSNNDNEGFGVKGRNISEINAGCGQSEHPCIELPVGGDAWIRLGVDTSCITTSIDVRLRIVKLDGLIVSESMMSDSIECSGHLKKEFYLTISMNPLLLAPGVYKANAELVENGEIASARSTVFKVTAGKKMTGGAPMLYAPINIKVDLLNDS